MTPLAKHLLIALVAMGLSACSTVRETLSGENSIDYKSAQRVDPLSIPPDLTQAAADPRYRAPASGSTTLSQFQSMNQTAAATTQGALTQVAVLPSYAGIEVKRDGNLRWLVVDQSPEVLFPKIEEFWYENGFNLDVIDPKAGIMITNWAENRAKIPETGLRELLGTFLETIWDSGEREKFRTILERVEGDRTEIFISHEQMVEVLYGVEKSDVQWERGEEDPGLNAAMLARLMVYLGEDVQQAREKMAQAQEQALKPEVQNNVASNGTITIDEPFEQAWRRVGLALDSGNFAVDDRNRSTGDFYVRYVDTDTGRKIEEPGLFSRLFGSKPAPVATQYRLNLKAEGDRTVVRVFDEQGVEQTNETANRILTVLAERL
ncbi:outer membrane protein assembly factor BamC [Orrella daihaiensis]|uniref:Outer membrane protein assembly factor BamC n=1 Tax=Orrella daihaiensis TaxID=2782176 RepID=A0ABY4ANE0_9BURK|nr:outer membrane protein assembly factor BamC [Orrella daihaiensis]UOD51146.1 outer membrane protein assembly factor BamC [Orrella daihaiensis]